MGVVSSSKNFIKSVGPLYRSINRLKGLRIHEETAKRQYVVIGSFYGQWAVDQTLLNRDSIIYAVGVGEDITFDLGLIEKVGCYVHAFDPTPIAVKWIQQQLLPEEFVFHPIGLGPSDAIVEFQVPPLAEWHSYSLTAERDAVQTGTVPCEIRRLSTIMADLGHTRIDLLKMDIEGFEYPVIDDMISSNVRPVQLLVEFHHDLYTHTKADSRASVDKILACGYDLFWVSDVGREYAFVLHDPKPRLSDRSPTSPK